MRKKPNSTFASGRLFIGSLILSLLLPPSALYAQDAVQVLHVQGNVHMITGAGANIAVQIGPDGLVVVDSGNGELSDEVMAAIRTLSNRPIRYLINTSAHPDHVGGNQEIAATGIGFNNNDFFAEGERAAIVANENVLLHMALEDFPRPAWPSETFIDRKNIYLNGESIEVRHFPSAYSDSDSVVFFRGSDVVVSGRAFDAENFPQIDTRDGGSINGVLNVLNQLVLMVLPTTPFPWREGGTKVIPATGHIGEQPDLVEYRDMVTIIRDVIQARIGEGMNLDAIKAANPTAGYNTRYGSERDEWTTEMFIEAIHTSLTAGE